MGHTTPIPAPRRRLSGSANITVLLKFAPDQPLLPWERKLENFNGKLPSIWGESVLVKFEPDQPLLPCQGKFENFSKQEIRSVERGICPIATLYLSLPVSCPVGSTQNIKIQ